MSSFLSNHHTNHEQKQDWPLDVFRYSDARGWEKQVPVHSNVMEQQHQHEQQQPPCAVGTPRPGYVFIRCFRLKLSLMNGQGKIHTEVVRRHDCLMFSSNNRLRCVVLKFPSLHDCVEFSTRLVHLNSALPPSCCPLPSSSASESPAKTAASADGGTANHELQRNEAICQIAQLLFDPDFQTYVNKVEQMVCEAGLLEPGGEGGTESAMLGFY